MAKRSKKKKKPPEAKTSQVAVAEPKELFPRQEIPHQKSPALNWKITVQALVIAAAVLWIYWPALHGGWLWDDDYLVSNNALVRDPNGLWRIWFDPESLYDYQPIKVSVVWLQWQLWGNDILGYHLTNVFLHTISASLVWRLLSKFGLRLAWLGGLVFAIHPVQVESVAWIAELKNTLSLPPFLLAMCAWIDYENHGKAKDYWLALSLFLAAMLCKPTMVMFPAVILLYAWWKRRRIEWYDVWASSPFFGVSLVVGVLTLWYLHHHAIGDDPIPMGGLFSRLACAGLAIAFYFSKCFLPVELMPIYPHWVVDPPTLAQFLPWPILITVIYWLWTKRKSWGRHALLGTGFFMVNLAPFIGLNAASYMAYTWVVDRVLYLPILGLIGLVVAALGQMEIQFPSIFRPYGFGLLAVVMVVLAYGSRGYAALYIDSEALWTYEVQTNSEAYPAHNNLGVVFLNRGQLSDAVEQYKQALRIKPDSAEAYYNWGNALQKSGRLSDAMAQYQRALQIKPDYAEAHYNLGNAFQQTGRVPEAAEQFELALRIKGDYSEAYDNLGFVLFQTGRVTDAIEQYKQALRIDPNNAEAHDNLGIALFHTGQLSEAMEQYEEAVRIKPASAELRNNLANALTQTGRLPEAIEQYEQALQIKPDSAEVHYNLAIALQQTGRLSEAIEQYEQVLRIKPNLAAAKDNLAKLQALQKSTPAKN